MQLGKYFGPSTLVTAAFIGPGTITSCTLAGVNNGYSLLWALAFSCLTTIVLQEMSARIGLVTGKGLAEAIDFSITNPYLKTISFIIIVAAIFIGNAAYESGNITGAAIGLELLTGPAKTLPLIVTGLCFLLLYQGKYKWVEKVLTVLVILMSISFLFTAILIKPDVTLILKGLAPSLPEREELIFVMSLIGTTVVPYNLFLHASIISKKYKQTDTLKDLRIENAIAIILGVFISMLIIIVAADASTDSGTIASPKDLAIQLKPLLGEYSNYLMGTGLFAAGISSAITAALAAAYLSKGIFKIQDENNSWLFKFIWFILLIVGCFFAMSKIHPIVLIKFAQIMNAILLPFIAFFLVYVANSKPLLGNNKNGLQANIMGIFVLLICILLCAKTFIILF